MKKIFKKSFLGVAFLLASSLNSCLKLTKDDLTQDETETDEKDPFMGHGGIETTTPNEDSVVIPVSPNDDGEDPQKVDPPGEEPEPEPEPNPEPEPEPEEEMIDSIILDQSSLSLYVGDEVELEATVSPTPLINSVNIIWESSDESIATVDGGVVRGLGYGHVTITAYVEGSDKSATCEVDVYNHLVSIDFDSEITIQAGQEQTLTYALNPSVGIKNTTVSYTLSNYNIAKVTNGKLKGLKEGTTTLTIKANEDNTITKSCLVTVTPKPIDAVYDLVDEGDHYSISWLNDVETRVVLPSEFNGKPITTLIDLGFDAQQIEYFKMPSSFTTIDSSCQCFRESPNIETFIFSDNIKEIPEYFFQLCENLTKVYIPRSLESVGECAFDFTGITDIYFGGSQQEYQYLNTNYQNGNSILAYPNSNVTYHFNASPDDL